MVISLEHAAQFVTALLDVGDKLPEGTAGMFGMDAEMTAQRIIYHYMRRETDIERRGNTVLAAIEDTIGHFLPVHLVWLDREQRGDQRGPEERLLSDDQVVKGRHLCLRKIEEALATPATLGQRLSFYLFRWKEWAGVEAPRAWVAKHVNTPDSAVLFLESLLRTVHRSVPPYVQHEIDLEPIELFIEVSGLETILQPLLATDLSAEHARLWEDHRIAISAFTNAVRRRREGRPNDGRPRHDGS